MKGAGCLKKYCITSIYLQTLWRLPLCISPGLLVQPFYHNFSECNKEEFFYGFCVEFVTLDCPFVINLDNPFISMI